MQIYIHRRLQEYLVDIISIYLLQKNPFNIPLTKLDMLYLIMSTLNELHDEDFYESNKAFE